MAPVVVFVLSNFTVFICVFVFLVMRILHVPTRQVTIYTSVGSPRGFSVVVCGFYSRFNALYSQWCSVNRVHVRRLVT